MKAVFSKLLCLELVRHYGRMPSASVVARDFNLRCTQNVKPITNETARRWIKGISIPELMRLNVLSNWIGLDIGNLQKNNSAANLTTTNTLRGEEGEEALLKIYRKLNAQDKRIIQGLMRSLAKNN